MIKKFVSATLAVVMTAGIIQTLPANALETDALYPYTMFAGSEEDGAITINTGNVCMNGSIATNGTIESTAANFNVNGQRLEHAQQTMIYAFGKLDRAYFDSGNVLTVDTDYTVEDINISLNEPVVSLSSICLNGNVNLNTQLKAEQNIQITGNSCNANNAALISHYGDIYIDSENFGYSGLIYAPYGDIVIESSSTNLNNVIVIGQTITIECPNLNVNYNTNAANIIGTISEDPDDPGEDDYLYAVGSYNEETNAIDISWSGNHLPDSVDIMVSADGEDYTLAATATDASVYAYPVGDNFISAYFKVSYTGANGNTVESLPFQASATEDGIVIDYPDSDGDSISDIMESILKTDPNKADTDDDGLTDQQELYITGTDPLVYDSAEPTVSDADADIDADSISNIDEIELGTDPQNPDTDDDRLTDREEVTVYLTDPQLEDTDGDSLNDGFEIRYGLDPLSPYTDGISDAERQIEQHIAADNPLMDIVNTEESPYEMSVQITMHGDAERELSVLESGYSVSLETDAQIGAITDVILPDSCEPEALRLTYAIKDAYRSNTLNKYTQFDDMQGIKRLCVFRYYDEIGMMLPLETQYDLENNTAYADVNMAGTYCVMDLEQWFDIFDVDPEQVQINATTQNNAGNPYLLSHTLQENTQVAAAEPNNTPISIYILLPCTGHNETLYKQQVSELEDFGSEILVKYPEAKISVFTVRNTFSGNDVEVNITSATYMEDNLDNSKRLHLNPAEYNLISDQKSVVTSPLYSGAKSGLIDDESQYKFVYDFQNSNIVVDDRNNALDLCENHSCYYSRIYSEDYHYFKGWPNNYTLIDDYSERIHQAILDCGGIDLTDMSTVAEDMVAHILETVGDTTTYEALLANRLKYVMLDAKLSPDNHVDTDEDTLTDWQEADIRYISVTATGTVQLPTIRSLLSHIDINITLDFAGNISAARDAMYNTILGRCVLPCKSDPTSKDTDGDGIEDSEDQNVIERYLYDLIAYLNLMEGYVDEYLPTYWNNNRVSRYPQYEAPSNSIVVMNILRNLNYGSGRHVFREDPIQDIWQTFIWTVEDGTSYTEIQNFINEKAPSLLYRLKNYNLKDKKGHRIDFLHLLTALSAERYDRSPDPNLAGWAGDLQSMISNLRDAKNSDGYNNTDMASNVYNLINGNLKVKYPKFPFSDLLADVDAKNMSRLYDENIYLSIAFNDYYVNDYTKSRFTMFVDGFGGIDSFYSIVLSYTYGCEIPKHLILILNSAIRRGSMVTVEESYALNFGFMYFLEDMINEENS